MNVLEEDLIPLQIQLKITFCATEAGAPSNSPWCWANPLNKFLCFMLRFSPAPTLKAVAKLWVEGFHPSEVSVSGQHVASNRIPETVICRTRLMLLWDKAKPQRMGRFQLRFPIWSQNILTPFIRHQKCHSKFWNVIPELSVVWVPLALKLPSLLPGFV